MKYKVNDKVRIKSIDWYNENKNERGNIRNLGTESFVEEMSKYCGSIAVIKEILDDVGSKYKLDIDDKKWNWTDDMIEGLVEESITLNGKEVLLKLANIELPSGTTNIWECPDGYIFKDEDGNIINTTKIVLEKKGREYPKTYEECCKVLGINVSDLAIFDNMLDTTEIIYRKNLDRLLNAFRKLLICRDAYWKIAGEEMGLGKPWKPDWEDESDKFTIGYFYNDIDTDIIRTYKSYPLAFPTKEMRDAFYENFGGLIEQCKELL